MIKDESFLHSAQLKQLQQRRQQLEVQEHQRIQNMQTNNQLLEQKLEKELEFLIKDRSLIEKRNNAIIEEATRIKSKTMHSLQKVKTQNENLVKSKQEIYDHLLRYHPKQAEEFLVISNLKKQDFQQQLETIAARSVQIEEKEQDLTKLQIQNQILKAQLNSQQDQLKKFFNIKQSNQQSSMHQFNARIVRQKSKMNSVDFPNTSYSMEQKVMKKYMGQTQSEYENYDESIMRIQPSLQKSKSECSVSDEEDVYGQVSQRSDEEDDFELQ